MCAHIVTRAAQHFGDFVDECQLLLMSCNRCASPCMAESNALRRITAKIMPNQRCICIGSIAAVFKLKFDPSSYIDQGQRGSNPAAACDCNSRKTWQLQTAADRLGIFVALRQHLLRADASLCCPVHILTWRVFSPTRAEPPHPRASHSMARECSAGTK
jgi:hypothetical protein